MKIAETDLNADFAGRQFEEPVEQLKDPGRLVIPVGERHSQQLLRMIKTAQGTVTEKSIPCIFVPLIGAGLAAPGSPVGFAALEKTFLLPLLLSPLVAIALTLLIYLPSRAARRWRPPRACCVNSARWIPGAA